MPAPAGVAPARPLGAAPCQVNPRQWEVPGASAHQIRVSAARCASCPMLTTYCASIPAELRPRGMVLGGKVVATKDGQLHDVETYLSYVRKKDHLPTADKAPGGGTMYGIDLSEVELSPEVLREILRGTVPAPARMRRKTRKLAIAIAVDELKLGDTAIARILLSTGGKPQPKSIERVRRSLGMPVRGGGPKEPYARKAV